MRPNNSLIMNAVDASSDQNSVVVWADDIVRASFQIVVAGSSTGSIQLQVSNDQAIGLPANQFIPTNWSNLGSPVTVSGAGISLISEVECSYEYMKLVWTKNNGSAGTITARMKSMGL